VHAAKLQKYGLAALASALVTMLVISGLSYRDWKRYYFVFEQTQQARGLGLATVYGIVQQHSGWIDVYSEPGDGATFKIYFPSAEKTLAESAPAVETPLRSRTGTILLVEDQAAIRMLAEDVLSEAGPGLWRPAAGERPCG
jgi:hypothetical protein